MASPFTVFRKNQKVMLAITGILAMIAFVFLGTCVQNPTPVQAYDNPPVVSWKFGEITEYEMDNRVSMRRILNQFIAGATSLAGQRDVRPTFSLSEEEIVRSMVLARRGRELGLVIGDDMVNRVLQEVTFNRVRPADLERIVASYRLGGQRVTPKQIFDALREEILASRVAMLFLNGLGVANEDFLRPLDTPAQRWDYFTRLERQATAQVLPVPVAEFTEEVGKPSEAELKALFEQHKDQFPSATSPEPGFRQAYRARFQYFRADMDELITAEMKNVPADEVSQYYEKNKDTQFRKSTLAPLDKDDSQTKPEPDSEKSDPANEGDASDAKEGDAKDSNKKDNKEAGETKAQSGETASDPKPEAVKKDAAAPPGKGDNVDAPKDATPADGSKPVTDEGKAQQEKEADANEKSARTRTFSPFRLANYQDEKVKEPEAPNADEQSKKEEKAQPEAGAGKDTPAGDAGKDEGKSSSDNKDPSTETAKESEKNTTSGEVKKDASTDDAAKGGADLKTIQPEPIEYRPLEQVSDEIRRTLARERVQKDVDRRLEALRTAMSAYASQMVSHRRAAAKNPDEPKPKPFELEALAEKHGVKAFTTEFLSRLDAETSDKLDIAKSRDMSPRSPHFFRQWTQIVFEPKGLLRPITTTDAASEASFLSWKTDEREGKIPEFDEVRAEVLDAWKRIKARDLAKKKAAEYADMVRKAKQQMAEVFAKEKDLPVREVGPFAWLTRPSVPLGMTQQLPPVQFPQIPGVDNAREEFMETTFRLQPAEVGVAFNHPKSIAYVIQVVKFEPTDAVLEQEFMVKMREYDRYRDAGGAFLAEAQSDWMDSLLTEYTVEWRRPPNLMLAAEE